MNKLSPLLKDFNTYHADSIQLEPNMSAIFVVSCCVGDDKDADCNAIFAGSTKDLKATLSQNMANWRKQCNIDQHIKISVKRVEHLSKAKHDLLLANLQSVCKYDTQ